MKTLRKAFKEALYWFRAHTYQKHHLVDCRAPQLGYGWGYCDRDQLMFAACFNILRDFVEKEDPFKYIYDLSENEPDEHKDQWRAGREIKELYDWWMAGRAVEHAEHSACAEGLFSKDDLFDSNGRWVRQNDTDEQQKRRLEYFRKQEELDLKDKAQLQRLIDVRPSLWT